MATQTKTTLPARYAIARPCLHRNLALAFRDNAKAPNLLTLALFYTTLSHLLKNKEELGKCNVTQEGVLAGVMASVFKGLSVGYSENPQNDIVAEVMGVLDVAFS